MKNKLHTTLCHPNMSLRVTKCIEKSNTLHFKIFSFLFLLCSFLTNAQPYQWQWAINGGGSLGESGWYYQVEQIFDIQVGTDDNYYFVAKIKNGTPQLGGQPVTVYGNQMGGNDIFIFSTTCDGQVRWSQAIGGGAL